jgi:tetratricopeptide (TPR) repeat protein
LIVLGLILVTLAGYWPVWNADFINLDDLMYVHDNPRIREGLTWKGARWALEADLLYDSKHADYWQPVTFLSRMADIEWFGLNAPWHHAENVLIHGMSVMLLFGLMRRMTGAVWRSGFVATVFAVHPLHVEAVAWITERKEVLGGLFWMLTLWAYTSYARQPGVWRYLLILLTFLLGLMAKPVGLVLPAVLLLLDWWPLNRLREGTLIRLVVEKVPLGVLAMASAVITLRAQGSHVTEGAVTQVINPALVGYAIYVIKAVMPTNLAPWHPPLKDLSMPLVMGSVALLGAITGLAWWQRLTRPWIAVGWLWFIVGLLPVIVLKDVAWAERFTYLPLTGLTLMVAWSVPETWWTGGGWRRRTLAGVLGLAVTGMVALTCRQAGYWKDSITLFEHTLQVTGENGRAHLHLGMALYRKGLIREARFQFERAIALEPYLSRSYLHLGLLLVNEGLQNEARFYFEETLRLEPDCELAHNNLAFILMANGDAKAAMGHFEQAVQLKPDYAEAHYNLGCMLLKDGKNREAIGHFQKALQSKPDLAVACHNCGVALTREGRDTEARSYFREAIRMQPDLPEAHLFLGRILFEEGHVEEAEQCFRRTLQLKPNNAAALDDLAWLLATAENAAWRNGTEAIRLAEQARQLTGGRKARALAVLAAAYAEAGRFREAVSVAQVAIDRYQELNNEQQAQQVRKQKAAYAAHRPSRGIAPPAD